MGYVDGPDDRERAFAAELEVNRLRAELAGQAEVTRKVDGLGEEFEDACVRATGVMDDAATLAEAAQKVRAFADELQRLHDEGYVLTDPASVRLEWIRAVPCPPREHSHDGWDCDIRSGVYYMPSRASRGAFQGVLADVAYKED